MRLMLAAVLMGSAVLPADTFAPGPPSGTFLKDGVRASQPAFPSQPVQGLSSLWPDSDGWFWALADNGYGTKSNSPDFLLRIYRVRPHFEEKRVEVHERFVSLRDPDKRVPFHLVNEGNSERLLTGADFDPESMVRMEDGTFWIGDEFGPFLLHVSADGRVLDPPVEAPGVRSPDSPFLLPANAGEQSRATVGRSRGFEGLARDPARHTLVALLEGGLIADAGRQTRALEFDPSTRRFTGTFWPIPLDEPGNSLTELVADGQSFLTIERDNRQGAEARFKKVLRVSFAAEAGVTRTALIDLLDIEPDFTFPYITTEALWPLPDGSVVLVNDNNYPAGGGRRGGTKDDTEFIRVKPH